jgi:methionine biosynthesis protein MetW
MSVQASRLDHQIIARLIPTGSRVLDLGCGDGELLALLEREKKAKVQGVELNEQSIYQCVAKGLSVVHSNLDDGLKGYPDHSFDYVILNESLQEVRHVDLVLKEAFRVGRRAIVGFPNFGALSSRRMLFFSGRSPVTASLPYHWYDTPNLRFLTIKDFQQYAAEKGLEILESRFLSTKGEIRLWPNLFASTAIFVVSPKGGEKP